MYSYYGLSAVPAMRPYLWWKKYITQGQLVSDLLFSASAGSCIRDGVLLSLPNVLGLPLIQEIYAGRRRRENESWSLLHLVVPTSP